MPFNDFFDFTQKVIINSRPHKKYETDEATAAPTIFHLAIANMLNDNFIIRVIIKITVDISGLPMALK